MKVINKNNMPKPFRLKEYKEYTIHRLMELEETGRRSSGKNNCSGYNLWKLGWDNMTVSEYQNMVKKKCNKNDGQYSESKHLIYDIAHGWAELIPPKRVEIEGSEYIDKIESDLYDEITKSKKVSSEVRKKRINNAPKKPDEIQIISRGFKRNPDVIVEVLIRADGKCEQCKSNAPFIRRKDNSPYLEVHHIIPLANGGDDSIENAIAVCPNCHRELHFGL